MYVVLLIIIIVKYVLNNRQSGYTRVSQYCFVQKKDSYTGLILDAENIQISKLTKGN